MTRLTRILSVFLPLCPLLFVVGCGGGTGGSIPDPTSTPRPTSSATPQPTNGATPVPSRTPVARNSILVRLRDKTGAAVDGVISLTSGTDIFRIATTNGDAKYIGFAAGNYAANAQVNDKSQEKTFTAANGATTVDFVFNVSLSPSPTATIPSPPFGNN